MEAHVGLTLDNQIRIRLSNPRILLWIGRSYQTDPVLQRDLPRLPLSGLYLKVQDDSFERNLKANAKTLGRHAAGFGSAEEVQAWSNQHLPIFYLEGRPRERLPSPVVQRNHRAALLSQLAALAEDRPIIVALGARDPQEIRELLEHVGAYAAEIPVFLTGDPATLLGTVEEAAAEAGLRTPPLICAGGWAELRDTLEQLGFPLLAAEGEQLTVLVGDVQVPLLRIFEDPRLRIDDRFRLITNRALHRTNEGVGPNELFHLFMNFDERVHAARVEEDKVEWHAINQGIHYSRSRLFNQLSGKVLKQLKSIEGAEYRSPRTCWLPAEVGAGTTTMLHMLALSAAAQGYPVLIMKQLVTDVSASQVQDFLTELNLNASLVHRRSGGGARHVEKPVLLVLDTGHAGLPSIEALPDVLVRVGGRQVLTLWAVRVNRDTKVITGTVPLKMQSSSAPFRFSDLKEIVPLPGDEVLPRLQAGVDIEDLGSIKRHIDELRKRGVRIPERDEHSWRAFQDKNRFRPPEPMGDRDEAEAAADQLAEFARSEDHFWAFLYHFLSSEGESPIDANLKKRVEDILQKADQPLQQRIMALLVEIAKASFCAVIVPQTALVDWIRKRWQEPTEPAPPPSASSAPIILTQERLQEQIGKLRESLAANRFGRFLSAGRTPEQEVREAMDLLSEAGLVRTLMQDNTVYVRFAHRTLARLFLREFLLQRDRATGPIAAAVADLVEMVQHDQDYVGVRSLLRSLRATPTNLAFCEYLSEILLAGENTWHGWRQGKGERRWEIYQEIPADLRNQSRILLHHEALILRRTIFAVGPKAISNAVKQDRLRKAQELLEKALRLPWRKGVRDDHPGHILTTLGLVFHSLAELAPAQAHVWNKLAEEKLREARLEVPDSKHTRMALAEILLTNARELAAIPKERERAVRAAAECLSLLSVEPTMRLDDWYDIKHGAKRLFSEEDGLSYLAELQRAGIEDGFLLAAEMLLEENLQGALALLKPLLQHDRDALRHHRTARRVAEIMSTDPELQGLHKERYRLLRAVETSDSRLTPTEEYQLAYLSYQLGHYTDGSSRFARLRAAQRLMSISGADRPYLVDDKGEPRRLDGIVSEVDEPQWGWGWMRIRGTDSSDSLFRVPFRIQHFFTENSKPRRNTQVPVYIRFYPSGPKAMAPRFLKSDM